MKSTESAMKFFHPRRLWRTFIQALRNAPFVLCCRIRHVDVRIGRNCRMTGCRVQVRKGNGRLVIGDNCVFRYCTFAFYGDGGSIVVGNSSTINARRDARTGLYVKDRTSISIGERGLISNSVEIATTDWHWIVDEEGRKLNENRDVHFGEHVWICRRVLIGKGVSIGSDSVVGAGSIVTKSVPDSHVLIAGSPAVVKRSIYNWK